MIVLQRLDNSWSVISAFSHIVIALEWCGIIESINRTLFTKVCCLMNVKKSTKSRTLIEYNITFRFLSSYMWSIKISMRIIMGATIMTAIYRLRVLKNGMVSHVCTAAYVRAYIMKKCIPTVQASDV
jgi:hypothetical protein